MFTGCGTALVTPFRRDQSLDEETLRKLVRRQIDAGINFLVPCGTTGESPTLTRAEHLRVVEITLEEARGKVPVLAGAGLRLTGTTPDATYVEIVEIPTHPFFLACQFHPEFKSKPLEPHPIFRDFIGASYKKRTKSLAAAERPAEVAPPA